MRRFIYFILLALLLLVAVLLINTLRLGSHQLANVPPAPAVAVPDSAIQHLAGAIRIPTVSYTDYALTDTTQFDKFLAYIRQTFPLVHQRLTLETINQYGLLYTWKGQNPALKPIILMGHYDVVPVIQGTQRMWKRQPFAGIIDGGYLYGRGTLDDKMSVIALLESTELLLKGGFQPTRTLLLSFGSDEETSGSGARAIVKTLQQRHVEAEYVLDEGGTIKTDGVAGLKKHVALVGISEKGYLSLELTAVGKGGHSSMPPLQTSIGMVAEAVAKVEQHPFPTRLNGGVNRMLDYLASEVAFGQRIILANQWLFSPLIEWAVGQTPSGRAVLRTTTAPTIFRAGAKDNVLPIDATATINFRILPGDSVAGVIQHVEKVIDNPEVKVSMLQGHGNNPSPISDPESAPFILLHRTIRSVFPDVIVAPYVMVGATDSKFFAPVCKLIYRFSPLPLNDTETQSIHGTNERIRVIDYQQMIQFYSTLIRASQ